MNERLCAGWSVPDIQWDRLRKLARRLRSGVRLAGSKFGARLYDDEAPEAPEAAEFRLVLGLLERHLAGTMDRLGLREFEMDGWRYVRGDGFTLRSYRTDGRVGPVPPRLLD